MNLYDQHSIKTTTSKRQCHINILAPPLLKCVPVGKRHCYAANVNLTSFIYFSFKFTAI